MSRYELADFEWRVMERLLPKASGIPPVDDRRVLNGIFWVLRSGRHGVTCPSVMGPGYSYNRFLR